MAGKTTTTNTFILFTAVAVLSLAALAADLSGMWTMRLVTTGGAEAPMISMTLKQDGDKLSGSCSLQDLDEMLAVSGDVKNDAIQWHCSSTELTVTFSGKVGGTGREITGSWSTSAAAQGTFIGTKIP